MFKISKIFPVVFLLGMVDQIEDGVAAVELSDAAGNLTYGSMPTMFFPCKIGEGDMFYFNYVDGITEIRCGEPPE